MTGPILVVGGRHRKGSAIPAVPQLAQLQWPTYQFYAFSYTVPNENRTARSFVAERRSARGRPQL